MGGAYSLIACLSPLALDRASLPTRSTVYTTAKDLQRWGAQYVFFLFVIIYKNNCGGRGRRWPKDATVLL